MCCLNSSYKGGVTFTVSEREGKEKREGEREIEMGEEKGEGERDGRLTNRDDGEGGVRERGRERERI